MEMESVRKSKDSLYCREAWRWFTILCRRGEMV